VLFLTLTLLCILRAEDDEAWAGRAGLPLALMVAARQIADVALAAAGRAWWCAGRVARRAWSCGRCPRSCS
jgi:hypothetical protein